MPQDEAIHAGAHSASGLRWYHKLVGLVWVVFCLEIGSFLLVYPWMDGWEQNFLSELIPVLRPWWDSAYLRGAVSGLGVVNIYIAMWELFRLLRKWFFAAAGEEDGE